LMKASRMTLKLHPTLWERLPPKMPIFMAWENIGLT
jgi:hypothetical protein